jgi:prepilin-type N-terminal cleavage/methylation domain-containing protein
MILRKIKRFHRNQAGFTLIEMIASVVICGFIALGTSVAAGQVITQTAKNNDYTTANRQVLNAMQWIGRDAQMAQTVTGYAGFPATSNLTLSWVTWDNLSAQAVYSVSNGQLSRTYTITGSPAQQDLIAQYVKIDPASSNCTWNSSTGELTLTITGSVDTGARVVNVTRMDTSASRPLLPNPSNG